jgi:hypothetical protein
MLGSFEGAILVLPLLGILSAYMSSNRVLPLKLINTDVIKLAIRSTLYS